MMMADSAMHSQEMGNQSLTNMQPEQIDLETKHQGEITDMQYDFYGIQIASTDAQGYIQVREAPGQQQSGVSTNNAKQNQNSQFWLAHHGAACQVAWAHPKFEGSLLATCGLDGKVKIWRLLPNKTYCLAFQLDLPQNLQANCLAWAPFEYGLILAIGANNGQVFLISQNSQQSSYSQQLDGNSDKNFQVSSFNAHSESVNGLNWAPALELSTVATVNRDDPQNHIDPDDLPLMRMVTGSSDCTVKLWQFGNNNYQANGNGVDPPDEIEIGQHLSWVRDVAWCPMIGLRQDFIATCSEDGTCKIWQSEAPQPGERNADFKHQKWTNQEVIKQTSALYKLSWNSIGNQLAVSDSQGVTRILVQDPDGIWQIIQQIDNQ